VFGCALGLALSGDHLGLCVVQILKQPPFRFCGRIGYSAPPPSVHDSPLLGLEATPSKKENAHSVSPPFGQNKNPESLRLPG
jgi:hypothetical protein